MQRSMCLAEVLARKSPAEEHVFSRGACKDKPCRGALCLEEVLARMNHAGRIRAGTVLGPRWDRTWTAPNHRDRIARPYLNRTRTAGGSEPDRRSRGIVPDHAGTAPRLHQESTTTAPEP